VHGTLAIALIGAVTGLASLAWQIYPWHHAASLTRLTLGNPA
jgi:hypothetical protein